MKRNVKFISKILLVFIFLTLLPVSLSSCEYTGKEIASVEYITESYAGGTREKHKIDFETGNVYESYYFGGEEEYKLDHSFDKSLSDEIIDMFYNQGLFNLLPKYRSLLLIMDGKGWEFTITYSDGTQKSSNGINAGPFWRFQKADEEYFKITGEDFLGLCDEYFMEAPYIVPSLRAYRNGELHRSRSIEVYPSEYTWNNKYFQDEYVANFPCFIDDIDLEKDSFVIDLSLGDDVEKIKVYSYADDSGYQEIDAEIKKEKSPFGYWQRILRFDAKINARYYLEIEYDYGIAKYCLSTELLTEKDRYKFLDRIDVIEYDKSNCITTEYRIIFSTGRVFLKKEILTGSDENLSEKYISDEFKYDARLSLDILEEFNELQFFDLESYTYDNDESKNTEWEIIMWHSSVNNEVFKTNDPEFANLLEHIDYAFHSIVGQYAFKWENIE